MNRRKRATRKGRGKTFKATRRVDFITESHIFDNLGCSPEFLIFYVLSLRRRTSDKKECEREKKEKETFGMVKTHN